MVFVILNKSIILELASYFHTDHKPSFKKKKKKDMHSAPDKEIISVEAPTLRDDTGLQLHEVYILAQQTGNDNTV